MRSAAGQLVEAADIRRGDVFEVFRQHNGDLSIPRAAIQAFSLRGYKRQQMVKQRVGIGRAKLRIYGRSRMRNYPSYFMIQESRKRVGNTPSTTAHPPY